jgi:hypothetical protein
MGQECNCIVYTKNIQSRGLIFRFMGIELGTLGMFGNDLVKF